jgi:Protein of unknown function (DUF3465)
MSQLMAKKLGSRWLSIAVLAVLAYFFGQDHLFHPTQTSGTTASTVGNAERVVAAASAARQSDVAIDGEGTVVKLLPDDLRGSRHQRFLLRLASGATLLVAHNIDLAPRLDALRAGDSLRFAGEYVWNERGGVLHWTHHDPQGRHRDGWLELAGRRYQ